MVTKRWIMLIALGLSIMVPPCGARGCLAPLFGEITDYYMEDLHFQIMQCCCYNNDVVGAYWWDDPESDGAAGSCSCSGWSANNCKTRRRYWVVQTEASVTAGDKNYHDSPGHWAGEEILTLSYKVRCFCYDNGTQERADCDIQGQVEVPLKYTKVYLCEDC